MPQHLTVTCRQHDRRVAELRLVTRRDVAASIEAQRRHAERSATVLGGRPGWTAPVPVAPRVGVTLVVRTWLRERFETVGGTRRRLPLERLTEHRTARTASEQRDHRDGRRTFVLRCTHGACADSPVVLTEATAAALVSAGDDLDLDSLRAPRQTTRAA